jgi:hypothetical protein
MSRGLLALIVALVVLGAAGWLALGGGEAQPPSLAPSSAEGDAAAPTEVPAEKAEAAPQAQREVRQPAKPKAPAWAPERLQVDAKWKVPIDPKGYMHHTLNESALFAGNEPQNDLVEKSMQLSGREEINPEGKRLSFSQGLELDAKLEPLHKQLLDLGQQELVAKGAAMHEAVEGGDFVEIEIAAMSRLQMPKDLESWQGSQKEGEVINYLNGRYGTFGRNYLFAVIGGNPAVPQKSWVVYSVRSRSPDYFKLRDQIEQLRSERDQQARTFIAAIR